MRFSAFIVRRFIRAQLALRRRGRILRLGLLSLLLGALICNSARAQVELPKIDPQQPIVIDAKHAHHWVEGLYDVWWLEGDCRIEQGNSRATSKEALLWIERPDPQIPLPHKVVAYLEGEVIIKQPSKTGASTGGVSHNNSKPGSHEAASTSMVMAGVVADPKNPAAFATGAQLAAGDWFGRFSSNSIPEVRVANPEGEPEIKPAVYTHAVAQRSMKADALQRTQFETTIPGEELVLPGTRRVRFFPRSNVPLQIQSFPSNTPNETIVVFSSGVNAVIEGLPNIRAGIAFSGSLDVAADRMVVWTSGLQQSDPAGQIDQQNSTPLELYLEGNVVVREGDRIVQAQAMYYNVPLRIGIILDAEVLTPVPRYQGLVRLKADVLKQVSRDRYVAERGSFTTSRIGVPTYEFRSGNLTFEDDQIPVTNPFTGQPQIDPHTGQPITDHEQLVTGENNVFWVEGVPVFYWPWFAADLEHPPLYFHSVVYRHDTVFGNQALIDLNPYAILGIRHPPKGTEWDISLDYLSLRGFGGGTMFKYDREGLFDWPGKYSGFIDAWYIDDHGIDNLGLDRRAITFPDAFRGRTLFRHQQELPYDLQLQLEVGEVTDRNFLQEYYQQEWDEQKDQVTRVGLRRVWDNMSLEASASALVDPFFTQTQNLPKLDFFWLGQPLLNDSLTLYDHSNIGYLRQDQLDQPTDPIDYSQFHFLPYDVSTASFRAATRNEVDWPIQLGPVKIVPYALGEFAHWSDDLNGDNLDRAYGQFGLRANVPVWSVDPTIQSILWNVNGVAHKVNFQGEFLYANASNNDLGNLPIYDAIDDNNVQAIRRRLDFEDYGNQFPNPALPGPANVFQVPLQFDERYYAVRRDIMGWVTGPTEIAGNVTEFKFDIDQRWQTKRGIPGQQHILDWITLDTEIEIFPDSNQNFGSAAGLFDYNFNWFVGDRLTVLSYGGFDFFDAPGGNGQKWATVGGYLTRPPRGSLYLGFNTFEGGPIESNVLTTSYTYRMSPKWLSTLGVSYDLDSQGNIGENIRLTRIGESFLFTIGFNVDASRNNVGFNIAIIPRFLGRNQSVTRGSVDLPPAGLYGLE